MFDLPTERRTAEQVIEKLFIAMERIGQVHPFAKGMGIAAPQIGIGRAAAIVQPAAPDAPAIVLLNLRITDPLRITVETTTLDGQVATTTYERGLARLIHHEIDHLDGLLYTARMAADVEPIPVEQYRQTGQAWSYEQ